MWVYEASEVNNWTVFAVGPNGANKNNNKKNKNNFASSRSDHRGPTIMKQITVRIKFAFLFCDLKPN